MRVEQELLPGAWLLSLKRIDDERGSFVKTFVRSAFDALPDVRIGDPRFDFREEFYSLSKRDVLRGMHFQLPPHDHTKLVYCAAGRVLDVLLDLRNGPGYGKSASVTLDAETPQLLVIPKGIAHGFISQHDQSLLVYKTSAEHAPSHDAGIRYDSFGFSWPCIEPILSNRDQKHPALTDFESPF